MEPLKQLLDRKWSKEQAESLVKIIDPLLTEEINRACVLAQQCNEAIAAESGTMPRDDTIPAMTLFLHIIEIGDGIHQLLKEGCSDAATPLLRSLFEAMVYLRFVVDKKNKQPDVPMAWYVNSLKNRRKWLEGSNPIKASRKKRVRKGLEPPPTIDEKKTSAEIKKELKRIKRRLEVDYKDISEKLDNSRNWYTPYGGGPNLETLSNLIGFHKEYQFFYRIWSSRIHASDTDFLRKGSGTTAVFRSIRDVTKLKDVGSITSTMLLNCIRECPSRC